MPWSIKISAHFNPLSRPRRIALALFSSILYILAFPNFNQSGFAWIALVPLILLAERSTPRQAFLWGWLSGTLAYCGILYWLITTYQAAHLSILLAGMSLVTLSAYLGLYWAAWAWFLTVIPRVQRSLTQRRTKNHLWGQSPQTNITHRWGLSPSSTLYSTLAGAAAWVALEYLRTYLFSGFPWTLLGDSQVKILPLIQIASITGVYGVSFLVVGANLAIAEWRLKPIGLALGVTAAAWLYGHSRMADFAKEPQEQDIRVAILQGSIDQYKKWDRAYVEDIEKTYERLTAEAAQGKPDMILWPETSVPGYLLQDPPLRDWLQKIVRQSHTAHVVGAPVLDGEKAYNAAFSLGPEGQMEGEYAKQHLVPFGEIVPWSSVLGRVIKVLNDLGGFTAGDRPPVILVSGRLIGINICYEAIFPNLVRQSVKQGAVLIANLTNDGWYMKSAEPYQHWAPNIFRAVENSLWLVRADNTGISGIIDPTGHVEAASRLFEPGIIQGTVHARVDRTLYTRFGDVFAWACVGIVFVSILLPLL